MHHIVLWIKNNDISPPNTIAAAMIPTRNPMGTVPAGSFSAEAVGEGCRVIVGDAVGSAGVSVRTGIDAVACAVLVAGGGWVAFL
jgi:hypothetical protein